MTREALEPGDHGGRALRWVLHEVEGRLPDGSWRPMPEPVLVEVPVWTRDLSMSWRPAP